MLTPQHSLENVTASLRISDFQARTIIQQYVAVLRGLSREIDVVYQDVSEVRERIAVSTCSMANPALADLE